MNEPYNQMTYPDERQQANEDRRRMAEESFEKAYLAWGRSEVDESDWATIAREMGISDFYKQLKGSK